MIEAKNTAPNNAVRLVEAMNMANAALLAAQVPFLLEKQQEKNKTESKKREIFFNCVRSSDKSIYADIYATEVAKHLSVAEIQQSILFFESAAGKRFNQQGEFQMYEMFGLHTNKVPVELSPNEKAELEEFQKTTAGNKLIVQAILSSDSVARLIIQKNEEVIKNCINKSEK